MRKVKFSYHMELQFSEPVWNHVFSLKTFPMRLPEQQIGGLKWNIYPHTGLIFHTDYFGNTVGTGRFDESHSTFRFELNCVAWVQQVKRKPEVCLPLYRYPSQFCTMTTPMQEFLYTEHIDIQERALSQAMAIMDGIYQRFCYQSGSTGVSTTAGEAFLLGRGVCQDYTHILITLCRAKGIPARYVAGSIPGEGATHAWAEVYDDGMWYGLDPTQNKMIDDGYLKLAQGRDAADCQLNRGVFCGTAIQQQNIYVTLEDLL